MPTIVGFLGYEPFPQPEILPQRLLAKRREMGWSIKESAKAVGADPSTWGRCERGQTVLYCKHRARVAQLLDLSVDILDQEMASRWNRSHEHAH